MADKRTVNSARPRDDGQAGRLLPQLIILFFAKTNARPRSRRSRNTEIAKTNPGESSDSRSLEAQPLELPRFALEAMALEGYRQEALSRGQVGEMLGLSFWKTEEFLKCHKAYLHYDEHDLEEDLRTHERLLNR